MQDEPTRRGGREQNTLGAAENAADGERAVRESIRQAFLVHMIEQQRQFEIVAVAATSRTENRSKTRDTAKAVREQQHTGNHEKPKPEASGADKFGGTRAGAENVEPKKR